MLAATGERAELSACVASAVGPRPGAGLGAAGGGGPMSAPAMEDVWWASGCAGAGGVTLLEGGPGLGTPHVCAAPSSGATGHSLPGCAAELRPGALRSATYLVQGGTLSVFVRSTVLQCPQAPVGRISLVHPLCHGCFVSIPVGSTGEGRCAHVSECLCVCVVREGWCADMRVRVCVMQLVGSVALTGSISNVVYLMRRTLLPTAGWVSSRAGQLLTPASYGPWWHPRPRLVAGSRVRGNIYPSVGAGSLECWLRRRQPLCSLRREFWGWKPAEPGRGVDGRR